MTHPYNVYLFSDNNKLQQNYSQVAQNYRDIQFCVKNTEAISVKNGVLNGMIIHLGDLQVQNWEELLKNYLHDKSICYIFLMKDEKDIPSHLDTAISPYYFYYQTPPQIVLAFIEKLLLQQQKEQQQHEKIEVLRRSQHELNEHRAYLENKLIDRTDELKRVYEQLISEINNRKNIEDELSHTIKELDTFVYKASHDLRGPLASLMGLINLARLEVREPQAQKYIEMMMENANRLNKILVKLLEITNIKYLEPEIQKVDFEKIIKNIKETFTKILTQENITLEIESQITQDFFSDSYLITKILENTIDNSIRYAKYDTHHRWINLNIQVKNDELIIQLSDNGQGIEKKIQSKIFDMFFKYNQSSKGSGIGLYLVKNCITKLKGKIELDSQAGEGATFYITLPNTKLAKSE